MARKVGLQGIKDTAEKITKDLDYELVDVEFVREDGNSFLRVYIYKKGGITLDDCQKMSELLSDKLDETDPIKEAYYLEVSSPGLDRPLKTDGDLRRNLGNNIELNLYKAFNNMKKIEGVLENFNEENLSIRTESDEVLKIPRQIVSLIKIAVQF